MERVIDVPVQATYIPIEDELSIAWWLIVGSLIYACQYWRIARKTNKSLWQPAALVSSILCAGVGYAAAIELLDYSVSGDAWWCAIAEFPNLFAAAVGYLSHNLPSFFDAGGNWLKRKTEK